MVQKLSKKQATARRIRAVAGDLFLRRGFTDTTVDDIAMAAGISRASLFNHYRGKPAIVAALAAEVEPRLLQLLQHYLDQPLSTAQRLEKLFAYAARVLTQTAALTRVLLVHGSEGAGYPALEASFEDMVVLGQQQGDVRSDIEPAQLAQVVYLAFIASLLAWCQPADETVSEQLTMRVRSLLLLLQP